MPSTGFPFFFCGGWFYFKPQGLVECDKIVKRSSVFSNNTTQFSVKVTKIGRQAERHETSDCFSAEKKE